jgi:hypothetical protein
MMKLLLGRHGIAPQKPTGGSVDTLVDGEVRRLAENIGRPLCDWLNADSREKADISLKHSNKARTMYTGKSVAMGALGMVDAYGTRPEDLSRFEIQRLSTSYDPALDMSHPFVSIQLFKNEGIDAFIDYWLKDRTADTCYGEPIVPFAKLQRRVADCVWESLLELRHGKRLGIMVSHGGIIEAGLIKMIEGSGYKKIDNVAQIGGPLDMGEFATLALEDGLTLDLRGKSYRINESSIA